MITLSMKASPWNQSANFQMGVERGADCRDCQ